MTSSKLARRQWLTGSAATVLGAALNSSSEAIAVPLVTEPSPKPVARGGKNGVATVHPVATEAGMRAFREGGNAIDAALSAALMLAVVDGHNSGLGGGCFILLRTAEGNTFAIDGRETAPGGATAKMFFRNGTPDPSLSRVGPLASGVPGAVAAYHQLSSRWGTQRWELAVQRAAEVASEGVSVSRSMANALKSVAGPMKQFNHGHNPFLHRDGTPLVAGERLVQRDLARTLHEMVNGPDGFYRGRFAELTERWMKRNGGILTREDLAKYRVINRQPIKSSFLDHQILGFPPPSSGGIHVAQILTMLERFDLTEFTDRREAVFHHVIAEAMRRAFADRAMWLGDPAFVNVPTGLLDPDYLKHRAATIKLGRTSPDIFSGKPPGVYSNPFDAGTQMAQVEPRHTTHIAAVDQAGNWVAITSTVNTRFGSKVVVPETGVVMNNEMDDFAIAPGVPNAFGLLGREANVPGPGKRPLSSMSPTIVLRDNQPVLTCGAAGGPKIISTVVQILLRSIALKQDLGSVLSQPRIHHQWRPNQLMIEPTLNRSLTESLCRRGHKIKVTSALARAQAIGLDSQGELIAASDPRVDSRADTMSAERDQA